MTRRAVTHAGCTKLKLLTRSFGRADVPLQSRVNEQRRFLGLFRLSRKVSYFIKSAVMASGRGMGLPPGMSVEPSGWAASPDWAKPRSSGHDRSFEPCMGATPFSLRRGRITSSSQYWFGPDPDIRG
jgi:hypothetical protein